MAGGAAEAGGAALGSVAKTTRPLAGGRGGATPSSRAAWVGHGSSPVRRSSRAAPAATRADRMPQRARKHRCRPAPSHPPSLPRALPAQTNRTLLPWLIVSFHAPWYNRCAPVVACDAGVGWVPGALPSRRRHPTSCPADNPCLDEHALRPLIQSCLSPATPATPRTSRRTTACAFRMSRCWCSTRWGG